MWMPMAAIKAFEKVKRLCPGCGHALPEPKTGTKTGDADKKASREQARCRSCGVTPGKGSGCEGSP